MTCCCSQKQQNVHLPTSKNSPACEVGSRTINAGGSVQTQRDVSSSLPADVDIILTVFPSETLLAETRIFIYEIHTQASVRTRTGSTVLEMKRQQSSAKVRSCTNKAEYFDRCRTCGAKKNAVAMNGLLKCFMATKRQCA